MDSVYTGLVVRSKIWNPLIFERHSEYKYSISSNIDNTIQYLST